MFKREPLPPLPSHCLTHLAHVLRAAHKHGDARRVCERHAARARSLVSEPHCVATDDCGPQHMHRL